MTALIIANTQIRCDAAGRYCLNDLHQASGGAGRHKPDNWLRSAQAQELIEELAKSEKPLLESEKCDQPVEVINGGFERGTYAVKELVYAYAMWISAAFHLHVIRAYDALVSARKSDAAPPLLSQPQHRADQLVAASRIFGAAMRAARQLRMPPAQALKASAACAARHTGIDWAGELDAVLPVNDSLPAPEIPGLIDLLAEREEITLRDVVLVLGLGDPESISLLQRLGAAMRTHGWRPHRKRLQRGWGTVWRINIQ